MPLTVEDMLRQVGRNAIGLGRQTGRSTITVDSISRIAEQFRHIYD
jgi:hypothetical protein